MEKVRKYNNIFPAIWIWPTGILLGTIIVPRSRFTKFGNHVGIFREPPNCAMPIRGVSNTLRLLCNRFPRHDEMEGKEKTKDKLSQMTNQEVRPNTMLKCTNKWSTPNKGWWHLGKTMRNLKRKKSESTTTYFLWSEYNQQRSHLACSSCPDQGWQNVGITLASKDFSICDIGERKYRGNESKRRSWIICLIMIQVLLIFSFVFISCIFSILSSPIQPHN